MNNFIFLHKLLSLGLSYPEVNNWIVIEKILMESDNLFEGETLSRVNSFKETFLSQRDKIVEIESGYLEIFDVGLRVSPYETEYLTEKISRKPYELADIAGFYRAFGFGIEQAYKHRQPVDHISVELEFMALLSCMELNAGAKKKASRRA